MIFFIHEAIHLLSSLLLGFIISKKYNNYATTIIGVMLGGFLIDLDHLIDYFFAFGLNFRLDYFIKGYQFLHSDKIFVLLHSFELAIIILIISIILIRKLERVKIAVFLLSFSMALLFHLFYDVYANELPVKSYFLTYRYQNNFELKKLVYPTHYINHVKLKKIFKFK
jgi:hypothetical protein